MAKNMKQEAVCQTDIENRSRRKVVKNIVCGVSALAAYNILPAKWGTPVFEQVFLPAHAQTSLQTDGTFVGNATFVPVGSTERNFGEFIADVGDSISDFLVSEAHAQMSSMSCCAELSAGNATFTAVDIFGSLSCIEASGSASAIITTTAPSSTSYAFRILSTTYDMITVEITVVTLSNKTYQWTGNLTRTNEPCMCLDNPA